MGRRLLLKLPLRYRQPWILTLLIAIIGLVLVELLAMSGRVSPILLSRPSEIGILLFRSLSDPEVQQHLLVTGFRLLVTFIVSIGISLPLSMLLWKRDVLRRAFIPLLGALFGTPLILLYLIFVTIFGRGTMAIVAISFLLGVIPIVVNATQALAAVDDIYLQVSKNFNADPRQTFFKVILPAAAPGIFAGIRIGFTYIMISVVAVEFLLVTNHGIGGMISNAYFRFRTTEMYMGITLIILLVAVGILLLSWMQALVQR